MPTATQRPITFKATIQGAGKTATGIEVPPEIVERLGSHKRPPVKVTLNGHTYRSTVAVMRGKFMISVSAENREAAGVVAGDPVKVALVLDTEPRVVEVPADFAAALKKNKSAAKRFEALSNSKKRWHVLSIEGAKTEETRRRRIEKAMTILQDEA